MSAWSATAALIRSRDRVADAQLPLAEVDHLDVHRVLAREVRLGLGALLPVLGEHLVAGLREPGGDGVTHLRQRLPVPGRDGEVADRLAERALGLVDARAGHERDVLGQLALRLAVQVADLVAVLVGRAGLLFVLAFALGLGGARGRRAGGRGRGRGARAAVVLVAPAAARDGERERSEDRGGQA